MKMNQINIDVAGAKVMRSYDYCHFEITLSTSLTGIEGNIDDRAKAVDDLRKQAARLADKAVEQYKIAKEWALKQAYSNDTEKIERLQKLANEIRAAVPEHERTVEEKAILKALADERYAARQYDYQDDWQAFDDEP